MELGIIGHETRGDEVIKILEMLGGKNLYSLTGCVDNQFYIMDNVIYSLYIGPDEIKGYEIFSLEKFLEKFPYKVGDKVEFWSEVDYYGRTELETSEIISMRWNSARCEIAYRLKDITREFYKDDIKGKVDDDEEQQIDSTIDYVELVNKTYEEEVGKMCAEITMDTLSKNGITFEYLKYRGYDLPEGHHFVDENGNVIEAKKILLVKNSPSYPKNYDECCDVLSMCYATDYKLRYLTHEHGYYECATSDRLCSLQDKLNILGKLIICRNAYWKIAGDYLELDKPWEPDWTNPDIDLYVIINSSYNEVYETEYERGSGQRIFAFPTIEMRDEFHNNFKDLIEQCKELL